MNHDFVDVRLTAGPIFESLGKRYEYTASCRCGRTEVADTSEIAVYRIDNHVEWENYKALRLGVTG